MLTFLSFFISFRQTQIHRRSSLFSSPLLSSPLIHSSIPHLQCFRRAPISSESDGLRPSLTISTSSLSLSEDISTAPISTESSNLTGLPAAVLVVRFISYFEIRNKFIVHVTPLNALEVAENSMKGFRDFYKANSDLLSLVFCEILWGSCKLSAIVFFGSLKINAVAEAMRSESVVVQYVAQNGEETVRFDDSVEMGAVEMSSERDRELVEMVRDGLSPSDSDEMGARRKHCKWGMELCMRGEERRGEEKRELRLCICV
ncbi:hypothetical protein LguiA_022558 [Lonicera macranthoides]